MTIRSLIRSFFLVACLTAGVGTISAQNNDPYAAFMVQRVEKNPIREFLNKFSFSFTGGYGRTFYKHQLPGYGVINKDDSLFSGLYLFNISDSVSTTFTAYQHWLTTPRESTITRFENIDEGNQLLSDTARLGYKGNSAAIPFTLTIHYNFLERFRLGGGIAYEIHHLPTMEALVGNDIIGPYEPIKNSVGFLRYFGMAGGKIYEELGWAYFVDIQIGKVKMGKTFDRATVTNGLFFNIGFPVEYEFSEYFRGFVRPSFEFKNYRVAIGDIRAITHQQPALLVHFGFRYNIPEIPRCPLKAKNPSGYDYHKNFTNKTCRIQKKHVHGNKAYRGQPFYKEQNPKIGENYRQLHKYRFFNRRKLNGGY